MKHKVTLKCLPDGTTNCYSCDVCGLASGDGDGLVGKKCIGKNIFAVELGRLGGKSKSPAKIRASKKNGRKNKPTPLPHKI